MIATLRRISWIYWLQQIHLWAGIVLSIPLVVLAITGSVLVYGHDIEHLFGVEGPRASAGASRSPDEIIAAAKSVAQPGQIPIAFRMPDEPGDPAFVRLGRGGGRGPGAAAAPAQGQPAQGQQPAPLAPPTVSPFAGSIAVMVDPVTLQVLGQQGAMTGWLRVFHDLHGNMLIPGRDGRQTVGWLGVVLLFLGCSGLILWWPRPGRWMAAFKVGKGARGARLHRELHGAVGIWSLLVFMLVNFTGVYLAFPETTASVIRSVMPGRDLRTVMFTTRVEPVRGASPISLNAAVALAQDAVPGGTFRTAFLPTRPDQPMRLSLARPGDAQGAPQVTVLVDPWAGKVVETLNPESFTAGETFLAWQRALHEGSGLGGLYKFIVFLSGLIIPLFVVTGISMWWLRRRARKALDAQRAAAIAGAANSAAKKPRAA